MESLQIKQEFKRRFIRQLVVAIVLLPAIVVFVFERKGEGQALQEFLGLESSMILYGALGLVAAGIIFTLWNWRCPACARYLGRGIYPKHCSGCGVALHD